MNNPTQKRGGTRVVNHLHLPSFAFEDTDDRSAHASAVILFDVDNTLLDSDRVTADLTSCLRREVGDQRASEYWSICERLRQRLGYADYLGAIQRYRKSYPQDAGITAVWRFLIDYPFANRLFPFARDAIEHAKEWGSVVLMADGDVVFEPRKIESAGLSEAVNGQALIQVRKEQALAEVEDRYPADHYVMFDDKLPVLSAIKSSWGARVTTVFVQQGRYARDPAVLQSCPPADVAIARIGDILNLELAQLIPSPQVDPAASQWPRDREEACSRAR